MEKGGQKGRKTTSGKSTGVKGKKGRKRAKEANSRGTQQRAEAGARQALRHQHGARCPQWEVRSVRAWCGWWWGGLPP